MTRKLIIGKDLDDGNPVEFATGTGTRSHDTLIYGAVESGKTSTALRLISESIAKEKRTWIIVTFNRHALFDTDPPEKWEGTDGVETRLVMPKYTLLRHDASRIKDLEVTDSYLVPVHSCTAEIIANLLMLKPNASYVSTLESILCRLQSRHDVVTIPMVLREIEDLMGNASFPKQLSWLFAMMMSKMEAVDGILLGNEPGSSIGKMLEASLKDGTSRLIVVDLTGMNKDYKDQIKGIVAMVAKEVMEALRSDLNADHEVGLFIDDLHHLFSTRKRAMECTDQAIANLMFGIGRDSRLWKIFATRSTNQVPFAFRDDVKNDSGIFSSVINTTILPSNRHAIVVNRTMAGEKPYLPFRSRVDIGKPTVYPLSLHRDRFDPGKISDAMVELLREKESMEDYTREKTKT